MIESKLRVFLSYARTDRARVSKIAEALNAAGLNVWWDTAIAGGASFSADIAPELDAADGICRRLVGGLGEVRSGPGRGRRRA